jgi:hypothetical protein
MRDCGQGSLDYLLLIGGAILVVVVGYLIATQAVGEGKNILETNLGLGVNISQTSADNVLTPLTEITLFTATGGDGKIILSYSAPGANSFILAVQEGDDDAILGLANPEDFDELFVGMGKFGLPYYESTAEYGAAVNGTTYYFRLRACNEQTCLVSDVQSAIVFHPKREWGVVGEYARIANATPSRKTPSHGNSGK